MKKFTHLHLHTEYSVLDGVCKIGQVVEKAVSLGQTALAITDHRNMFGCIPFYKACKEAGIKPIIGSELNIVDDLTDKTGGYHVVLLVKDAAGYRNLCQLCTLAYQKGQYDAGTEPVQRIEKSQLKEHREGLICLSGCINGEISALLAGGNYQKAKETAAWYKDIFGDDYYLEAQNHNLPSEFEIIRNIKRLSKELDIKVVATNDVHYVEKEDCKAHETVTCIRLAKKFTDPDRPRPTSNECYLKSGDEMFDLFKENPEFLDNTADIVDKCSFEYEFGITRLPQYEVSEEYPSHISFLRMLSEKGLIKRYGQNISEEITARLNYELETIDRMGYTDYFLIVWDFINWSKKQGIPVGPGRGSGAGSIVAYLIGITDIDPIRYNLYFERFLNPERVSMPDFDIDFCVLRRKETMDYVARKYGAPRVSKIITFGVMLSKGALHDSARVLGIPDSVANSMAKLIKGNDTIAQTLASNSEFIAYCRENKDAQIVAKTAQLIEGLIRNISSHAAGVLICDRPITDYAPMILDKEGNQVIQGTMAEVEKLGLLKFDFLGLRNLTIIDSALKMIEKNTGVRYDLNKIDIGDPAVYSMLAKGDTNAVFQFESEGITSVLKDLVPTCIEDMIAVNALYRPGPMDEIPKFIKNKRDPKNIEYLHPSLAPILGETYGCIVYQEQVMKIFQSLAGYSLGRADIVRRAMSKKKKDVIEQEKRNFIYGLKDDKGNTIVDGALARGIPKDICDKLMDQISAFASYAFNKAHSAAYSIIAYRTAWLKCHFPYEFMCATMDSLIYGNSSPEKIAKYCSYITDGMRLNILQPDINKSSYGFIKEGNGIRYGLALIKDVGEAISENIVKERDINGPYTSLYNFLCRGKKYKLNKGVTEALIKVGALDFLPYNRNELLGSLDKTIKAVSNSKETTLNNLTFFDMEPSEPEITKAQDLTEDEKYSMEFEYAHMYITSDPLKARKNNIARLDLPMLDTVVEKIRTSTYKPRPNSRGEFTYPTETFIAILSDVKKGVSKKGNKYGRFTMRGKAVTATGVCFARTIDKYGQFINDNACLVIKGCYKPSEEEGDSKDGFMDFMVYECSVISIDTPEKKSDTVKNCKKGFYARIKGTEKLPIIMSIATTMKGNIPLFVYDENTKRLYKNADMLISPEACSAITETVGIENIRRVGV